VTLGALRHYRRTGGSRHGALRLATVTAAGTLVLTVVTVVRLVA
jgi:hypothetical protein